MKNKNFTPKLYTKFYNGFIVFLFLFAFMGVQNLNAQTQDCPLSCNDMVQVSLDDECIAIVTPEMVIEGENDAITCDYEIYTIVDENNNVVGHSDGNGNWILDGDATPDYTYRTLMATVGFQSNHDNSCMGGLRLEDKIAPTLRCLDTVYVACSEDLSDYLNTDTDASYAYSGTDPMVPSGGGTNFFDFPVDIPAGDALDIPIDVNNEANQSEIMNFVQAVLTLSTFSNVTVEIQSPTENSTSVLTTPFIDDFFYGIQADDQYVGGLWHIIINNNNASAIQVTNAKLRIKSTGFLRIGNGVIVNDNCHLDDATVEVLADFTTPNDTTCASYFQERIIKYQGTDWRGMKTPVCEHVIRWEHNGFDDMEWPHNWDGIDNPPLSCTGHFMQATPGGDFTETNQIWDTNGDGYPQPDEVDVPTIDGNPIWPDAGYCMINVTFSDEVFEICPGSFKILRKWIAYDMCEAGADDCCNDDANPRTHYQIIKVIDNTPITFETNHLGYVEVSANPFDCSACVTLPVPIIQNYGCSEGYTYEVGYCPTGNGIFEYFDHITSRVVNGETVYTICELPVGETCVRYIVTDLCGNKSYGTLTVKVIDDIPPIPVCDEHTVATVTTDCTARVNAETFDDGSFDNCSDVSFKVARMNGSNIGPFGDYVDFGSSDVGKTSQVVLKVLDAEGNWNTCMVEVYVDDKIPPQVFCPENVNIDCNVDPHDVELTGGEADYWDNCGAQITHEDFGSLNQCNVGTIRRVWTVTDNSGKQATCTQYIYVENYHPFKMRPRDWPRDVNNLLGCSNADTDPSNTGEPNLSNDDFCSMVAATYSDRIFNVVDGACYKILRDWTVIDWCQYGDDPVYLGLPGHPYEGMWVHTQIIMVNDYNAPVFTSECSNQTICAYNSDCTGDVTIVAEADDECTPDNELVWSYRVTGPNLDYPLVGNSNTFNRTHMELGWYDIFWTVEDKCGNISECNYSFQVVDCKNPTPLCYSEITTVLMPTTDPRMVSIKARDFDRGSDDNCDRGSTCEDCYTDLRFSFSGTNPYDSIRTFTEDDEGLHTLDMWVWDQAGNKDFCTVTVYIQDNVTSGTNAMIAGQIITEDDKKVENAKVKLEDMQIHESVSVETNSDGFFEFSVPVERDYKIEAEMNDNYLNGLTTLDLVIIQKHILGIKDLNTPYKLLAADANNDQRVTASDILALRKLILGTTDNLVASDPWIFVDNDYEFINPKNPWLTQEQDMHTIYLNNVNEDVTNNHFIAIKTGDVNNSAVVNGNSSSLVGLRGMMSMDIENKTFKSGEMLYVPVKSSTLVDLSGMQFSLELGNNLSFERIESNDLNINENNYSVHNNKVFFSWNAFKEKVINEDEILFTLVLKANKNGQLINQLNLVPDLNPEAYNENLDVLGLELNYRNVDGGEFVLNQNTPNPFSNETEISFNLPKSGQVTITVFDVTGKVILKKSGEFDKGYNSVKMSKDDLNYVSGVLYYKVETEENMAVKKMIVLAK